MRQCLYCLSISKEIIRGNQILYNQMAYIIAHLRKLYKIVARDTDRQMKKID